MLPTLKNVSNISPLPYTASFIVELLTEAHTPTLALSFICSPTGTRFPGILRSYPCSLPPTPAHPLCLLSSPSPLEGPAGKDVTPPLCPRCGPAQLPAWKPSGSTPCSLRAPGCHRPHAFPGTAVPQARVKQDKTQRAKHAKHSSQMSALCEITTPSMCLTRHTHRVLSNTWERMQISLYFQVEIREFLYSLGCANGCRVR